MTRARLWTILAVVGAVLLVTATGGFGIAQVERPVSISVAQNSENAFVGITGPESVSIRYGSSNAEKRQRTELFTVTNNFDTRVELSVRLEEETNTPPDARGLAVETHALAPSESTKVTADVVCASQADEAWTIRIVAVGADFEAEVLHTVSVSCDGPDSTD